MWQSIEGENVWQLILICSLLDGHLQSVSLILVSAGMLTLGEHPNCMALHGFAVLLGQTDKTVALTCCLAGCVLLPKRLIYADHWWTTSCPWALWSCFTSVTHPFPHSLLMSGFFSSISYKISFSPWNLSGFREIKGAYYIPTQMCIIVWVCIPLFKCISEYSSSLGIQGWSFLGVSLYCFIFSVEINKSDDLVL